MTATLLQQTSGGSDLLELASGIGWREIQSSPQDAPTVSNTSLWTAISEVAHYDAQAGVRPSLSSDIATHAPDHLAFLEKSIGPGVMANPSRAAPSLSVSVRSYLRPPRPKRRARARGFANLNLTLSQRRQVAKLQLQARDQKTQVRAYDRFQLIRQWEGEVLDVETKHFRAAVITPDARGRSKRDEMRIPLRLVRASDHGAVVEGAQFYYCVGRLVVNSVSAPGSLLWFRRFPENPTSVDGIVSRVESTSRIEWSS
jgi:hypothetical protein